MGNRDHFYARFEDNSELFDENLRETGAGLPLSQPVHPKSDRLLDRGIGIFPEDTIQDCRGCVVVF
ncbi:MAG: hypothetical protein HKP13_02030 [Gammaproteobacteria bacterium]|nr:hypothetical protein [Gammaproteobacteria bacterium]